ncbi:MAG TPA: hypothetical protein V6C46_07355, partial [Coleofasciculaceae cyanobacterium]
MISVVSGAKTGNEGWQFHANKLFNLSPSVSVEFLKNLHSFASVEASLDYSRTPQLLAVIPVATGIQVGQLLPGWIPAYAGMT